MMTITELQQRYAAHPNVEAMSGLLKNPSVRTLFPLVDSPPIT